MFCKSGEDLQLCPKGGSMEDTGGLVGTGVIVTWHLVHCVTRVRVLFAFLPLGQACFLWVLVCPNTDHSWNTRGFKKKRLLHKTTKTVDLVGTGRTGQVVWYSTVSTVDCGDAEKALFPQPSQ